MRLAPRLLALFALALPAPPTTAAADELPLARIRLPPGFAISVYARVPGARSLALGDGGTVFVGTRGDKVYAVRDEDGDGVAERSYTIASGLTQPNGVAVQGGALYVAEIPRVVRYPAIERSLARPPRAEVVRDDFPTDRHHGWKFIAFGPDGKLYVPVGAPCNVCESDARYAAIFRMNADGSGKETVARGVRNTVGFDWHPTTGELWFTDNGRDMLGDDVPPDELNRVPRGLLGADFGFPRCHGKSIPDPQYGRERGCSGTRAPERELGPHVAALGMRFYTGSAFPAAYRHAVFIAEHGSWNRSQPIGYRVSLVRETSRGPSYETFAEGWLGADGNAWGRPVDVLQLRDGSLLVSDDEAGALYRITYRR